MSEERRISGSDTLVVHQGALGDLVLTLSALKHGFSQSPPDIFCRLHLIPLVVHLNAAANAFNVEGRDFARLYSEKPDKKLQSWFAPYRQILLFSNSTVLHDNIRALANCPVYAIPTRPGPERRIHMTDHLIWHLSRVFPEASPVPPALPPDTHNAGNRDVEKILIHPGSGSPRKNWPLENYIRVDRRLRKNGIEVEWIIGPAEKFMLKNLTARGIQKKEIRAHNDLVDFCRQLKPSTGFIGNDSGLTHLAAWLGAPVIALFGPSDPERWKPVGPHVTLVRPQTDCMPCFETQPDNCPEAVCLKRSSPEEILTAIVLWEKRIDASGNGFPNSDSSV